MDDGLEEISGVAIRHDGKFWALAKPSRHHDVLRMMCAQGFGPSAMVGDQGFMTSAGCFVTRWQGHRIAFRAGQTKRQPYLESELFSEDVW
jgi:hypothetical protein